MAAQLPDCIIVDGEFKDLYSNPLEQYWTSNGKKRPSFISSHNCTRGYVAIWHLKDSELFLVSVDGYQEKKFPFLGNKPRRFTIKTLFSRGNRPVKATWFSGKLRVPQGNMMVYEHSNYDSRFEKEMIITIEKGELVKMVTLDCIQKTLILNSEILLTTSPQKRQAGRY